ncbi:MAG: sialidase family protein [bacterium]
MRLYAWAVAALSLASLLAGCSGSEAPSSTSTPPPVAHFPDSPATTFYHFAGAVPADARVLGGNNSAFLAAGNYSYIGTTTYEPSIGATKSGALFMTSLKRDINPPNLPDQGTHIIRGLDSGHNWTDTGPFIPTTKTTLTVNSNDPYMYVDPWTSRVIDFDMCGTLSAFCMSYSDDDGATWTPRSIVTGESTALDHQSIAAAPAGEGVTTVGYPNVLVFCVNRGLSTVGPYCSTSRDGGINWSPLIPGSPAGKAQCSGLSGHVHGSIDGRFYRGNPSCTGPAVYRSDDGGLTWSEHTINTTSGSLLHDIEVGIDAKGNVYAGWIADDGLPYLALSRDHGDTWPIQMMVAPPGVTATGFPAVAAGADGRVVMAYIGTTLEKGYDGSQTKATWNGYLSVLTDAFAENPLITTVTVNDPATDPLSTGACGNVRCGGFGDFIDVTIDPSGRPWAAMANNEHGDSGLAVTMVDGPALLGDLKPLPHLTLRGPATLP